MNQDRELTQSHSTLTRRQFLLAVAAGSAAFITTGATTAAAAVSAAGSGVAENPMSLAALSSVAGTRFQIAVGDAFVYATLEDVTEQKTYPQIQQYTATFRINGSALEGLTQQVYEIKHPKLGEMSLLMTPTETGRVQQMSACFCQLV